MRKLALIALFVLFAMFWVGGIISYTAGHSTVNAPSWAAPAFLWTAASITLLQQRGRNAVILLLAGGIAFAAEYAGVTTGAIFGDYSYTDALGVSLLGVPLSITAAWIVLLGYTWDHTSRMQASFLLRATIGALWMTAIDLVIDPLAAGPLRYWAWHSDGFYFGVPLHNFAGWFLVSFCLHLLLHSRRAEQTRRRSIGLAVILFFSILAALNALFIPAAAGVALLALDLALSRTEWVVQIAGIRRLMDRGFRDQSRTFYRSSLNNGEER